MSYNSRSPDRADWKHRRPAPSDHFNNRQLSKRAGNSSSPSPVEYSSAEYDRRARSPPRGIYHPESSFDRYIPDVRDRQVKRSFSARDRSISPRDRRERPPPAHWDNTDRDRFVENYGNGEAYRPIYPSANSSRAASPSRPSLVTLNLKDSRNSSAISSADPNHPNKNGSAISSTVSSPFPNQPEKPKSSKATKAVLSPHPRSPPPNNGKKSPHTPQAAMTGTMKELSELLYVLIEEATDLAALKTQKGAAERDFTKREKDFNTLKPMHEKFPAAEAALRESKAQAKKTLHEITQKCEEKNTTLKSIALQGATQLLSVAGGQVHNEKTQERIDSLQKRCQDLEDQLRKQRSFIETQQSSREALEANFCTIQEEMAAMKSREIRDFHGIKKEVSDLHNKIPQNLELRLNDLATRSLDKPKDDSASTSSAKAIADHTMIMRDYGQRLRGLEDQVRDNKDAFSVHVKSVVETQSKFRDVLENTQRQNASLKESITTLESVHSTATNTPAPAPEFDPENFRREVLDFVESSQAVYDSIIGPDIDGIKKAIARIDEDMKNHSNSDATYPVLSDLQTKLDERSHNERAHHSEIFQQIDVKYQGWAERIENVEKAHQSLQTLHDRVEAIAMGINHVNTRLNGLNTREMAVHILSQMDSTYPNLREAQNTINHLKASLQTADARFLDIDTIIKTIIGRIDRIGQNNPENPEAGQALHRQLAQETKAAIDAVSTKSEQDAEAIAARFADVYVEMDKLTDKLEALSEAHPHNPASTASFPWSPTIKTRNRPVAKGNGNGNSNSNSSNRRPAKVKSPAVQKPVQPATSRQVSGEPLSKKRRAMAWPQARAVPPQKPNGVRGSRSPGPGRKKQKVLIGGDDSDDIDFEPPEPAIDDDDDDDF